jgi:hypothetical protein
MEGQLMQMDVDRELVLSRDELSKLNDEMNFLSQLWTIPKAEEDVDTWNKLTMVAVLQLSLQLSSFTSKRDLFSLPSGPSGAQSFMENLKDDELKEWKEGVRMGMKEGNWEKLVMHRTSSPGAD